MNVLKYGRGTKKGFKKDGRFEKGVDKTLRNGDTTTEAGTLTDTETAWPSGRAGDRKLGAARHPPQLPAARSSGGEPALSGALGWEPLGRVAHGSHQMSRMSRVATMA